MSPQVLVGESRMSGKRSETEDPHIPLKPHPSTEICGSTFLTGADRKDEYKTMKEVGSYKFGDFRVDPERQQLTRQGEQVQIRPRHFEVLLFLLENRGQVVTREAILDQAWTGLAIEDSNLSQAIHSLRRIIDDPGQRESWILTIPKRGYLFLLEISREDSASLPDRSPNRTEVETVPTIESLPPDDSRSWAIYRLGRGKRIGLVPLLLAISFVIGFYIIFRSSVRSLKILSHYTIPSEQLDPEFSPDGQFLAFSGQGETGGNEDIYLKSANQDQRVRLTTHPDADRNPVWSPDGKRLAFLRWSNEDREVARVIVVDPVSGLEEEVGRSRGALGWMPDGRRLIVNDLEPTDSTEGLGSRSTVLFLLPLSSPARRPLTPLTKSVTPGTVDTMPRAALYRETIAFLRTSGGPCGEIYLLDLPSGRITQATHEDGAISFFRWGLREGGFYLVSTRTGVPRLWHFGLPGLVSTIYGTTGPSRLVDQVPYQLNQFTTLPDPPLLAYARQIRDEQVRLIDLAGQRVVNSSRSCLLPGAKGEEPPQFSPNGDRVAYLSTLSGKEGIWIANSDCTRQAKLIDFDSARIGHLRWSPDGSRLVYEGRVGDQTEIWTIGIDGSVPLRLTVNNLEDRDPSWSHDGRLIYYVAMVDGRETIRRLPSGGGKSALVVSSGGREPVGSTDGRILRSVRGGALLAFSLSVADDPQLTSGSWGRHAHQWMIGRTAQFSPTGVTFLSDNPGNVVLEQIDLSTGKTERIAQIEGIATSAVAGFALSPDNRSLSIVLDQGSVGELTTVEGWRLKPFSEYMVDRLYLEPILNPQLWWRKIRN
jgi:Tol biopolymer transport system component/DNA-binding winged helix-turn-helix (wHTH) protein